MKLQGVVLAVWDVAPVDRSLAGLQGGRVLEKVPQLDADPTIKQRKRAAAALLQFHLSGYVGLFCTLITKRTVNSFLAEPLKVPSQVGRCP